MEHYRIRWGPGSWFIGALTFTCKASLFKQSLRGWHAVNGSSEHTAPTIGDWALDRDPPLNTLDLESPWLKSTVQDLEVETWGRSVAWRSKGGLFDGGWQRTAEDDHPQHRYSADEPDILAHLVDENRCALHRKSEQRAKEASSPPSLVLMGLPAG
jgi:hypothetical protein